MDQNFVNAHPFQALGFFLLAWAIILGVTGGISYMVVVNTVVSPWEYNSSIPSRWERFRYGCVKWSLVVFGTVVLNLLLRFFVFTVLPDVVRNLAQEVQKQEQRANPTSTVTLYTKDGQPVQVQVQTLPSPSPAP